MSNSHPFEVGGRGSGTQLQVDEIVIIMHCIKLHRPTLGHIHLNDASTLKGDKRYISLKNSYAISSLLSLRTFVQCSLKTTCRIRLV